jgi:hypothetical protein
MSLHWIARQPTSTPEYAARSLKLECELIGQANQYTDRQASS